MTFAKFEGQIAHALTRQLTSPSSHSFEIANETNSTQIARIYLQLRYIARQPGSHFALISFLCLLPDLKSQITHADTINQ